jgi:hypothetical protein
MRRVFVAAVLILLFATGCQWQPRPGVSWQWQLTGKVDTSVDAQVFDVDLFDTPASVVADLHARGRQVLCYIDVGTWESWRSDAAAFPASVQGRNNGWPGEKWLDIRRLDLLRPALAARIDLCRSKGFDGVEPDNVDGYLNNTGFPLTARHQLAFNRWIARTAHDRGLAVALKNDVEQVPDLVNDFDFAINEECVQYDECEALAPFIDAGKAVLYVDYDLDLDQFCPKTTAMGFSAIRKHPDLDAWLQRC